MVRVAIAGGSGQVAREVIDALLLKNKHEIVLLTRTTPKECIDDRITQRVVDYDDTDSLVDALVGVHTVLSFVQILLDVDQKSQRNLVDAAVLAGVKRFAPSEYGSAGTGDMPWWEGKQKIREYLKKINEPDEVLEYCLFQPGLFLDYLAFPHQTSKHLSPLGTVFDFEHKRAIVVDGHESAVITLTTVSDFATIVAMSVDHSGAWPVIGGIQGNKVTVAQIIAIGEKIQGRSLDIERVKIEDLEEGKLTSSWSLEVPHKAVSAEDPDGMLKQVAIGMLLSTAKGAWEGSSELNQIYPDYHFTSVEDFLAEVWSIKRTETDV